VALANGTKLGPYEIVAPLGAGGMGEVISRAGHAPGPHRRAERGRSGPQLPATRTALDCCPWFNSNRY